MKEQIKDLIEYKELNLDDYSDAWELYDDLDYDGSVHELVDGMIDIYYYDIRKWAVDNWEDACDWIGELIDSIYGELNDDDYDIQYGEYQIIEL